MAEIKGHVPVSEVVNHLRKRADTEPLKEPKNASDIFEKMDPEKMYKTAYSAWSEVSKKLENKPNPDMFTRAFNIRVRTRGLLLHTVYTFFDKHHSPPLKYRAFLSRLGKIKDYEHAELEKPGEKLRDKVVDDIPGALKSLKDSFKPVKPKEFQGYVSKVLNRMTAFNANTTLTVPKYHELRKHIRHFANLFEIYLAQNYKDRYFNVFAHLHTLSHEMGKTHQDFVVKGYKGEAKYSTEIIELPEELKVKIGKVIELMSPPSSNYTHLKHITP